MSLRLLPAFLALFLAAPAAAQPAQRNSLHGFLQSEFRGLHSDSTARYMVGWTDLDGDRRPEAIVYLQAQYYCGTGGCTLFIYKADGSSWRRIARQPTNDLPIRVLNTRSRGWRDLASRGSMLRNGRFVRYEERMVFDGQTYPVETTTNEMRPLPGRVVIRENDRGRPLF